VGTAMTLAIFALCGIFVIVGMVVWIVARQE
jgi:hypothetical protein